MYRHWRLAMRAKLVLLAAALMAAPATATEPWQQVLVLGSDTTEIGALLKECEFKATVTADGPLDKLTQRIAQQALEAGGNTVHILGATNIPTTFALKGRGTANGRAFFCERKAAQQ